MKTYFLHRTACRGIVVEGMLYPDAVQEAMDDAITMLFADIPQDSEPTVSSVQVIQFKVREDTWVSVTVLLTIRRFTTDDFHRMKGVTFVHAPEE